MDTKFTHSGVELDLLMNETPFEIKGRGWAHPAKIIKSTDRTELEKLIGAPIWNVKVLAVESFAVHNQPAGRSISLLLERKMW